MYKILITGADGLLGKNITQHLKNQGHKIYSYSGDVQNKIEFNESLDVIIHLAAKAFVPDSIKDPHTTFNVNVLGTLNVLEYARLNNLKVIFPSTAGVYKSSNTLIDENFLTEPSNPYTESKYLGELLCNFYSKNFKINCLVLRIFNVYGIFSERSSLIKDIYNGLINDQEIRLSSPDPIRDYVHIEDVSEAFRYAVESSFQNNFEIINIGSGIGTSVEQMVNSMSQQYGKKAKVHYNGFRKNEISFSVANIIKANTLLGWKPKISLEEGIKKMISKV